ncbi:TAR DNA-binding protein 43 [Hydra vulgaris]|uniref:TAR DNA-binding protein 43 n=1 Tax=Hydra vulgaris TaxID=6087 RepID=A0ABM4CZG8_HYDVU|nr:TAR DNA-binding protein 43 [Hydra vulgaris]XP_047127071.1 TAR DNA-binding protein 43 [Hydra vulgaris]
MESETEVAKTEVYPCYVKVADDDHVTDVIEIPTEKDGTIMLSTIQAQFPNAIGLKYKGSSGAWRGVRISGNILDPPFEGWGENVFCTTIQKTDSVKRKLDESPNREPEAKLVKTGTENDFLSDLIVLGLPYKATNQDLKDYFLKFGELAMYEIKIDPLTKESRGFAFIRFKNEAAAQKVLKVDHSILGRRCEVRLPKKKENKRVKLFIGRLPADTSEDDLRKYFSDYGELTDVYLPTPFRGFGFVTYAQADDAQIVLHKSHSLKGSRMNVTIAEPKGETRRDFGRRESSGRSSRQTFDFEDMRRLMYNNTRGYSSALTNGFLSNENYGYGKSRTVEPKEAVTFIPDAALQQATSRNFWAPESEK